MATTVFAFGHINADLPDVLFAAGITSEEESVTTSNAATEMAARADQNVCLVSTDTTVYVSFGAEPDATTDTNRFLLLENHCRIVRVKAGDKGAAATLA